MRIVKKSLVLVLGVALCIGVMATAYAGDEYRSQSQAGSMMHKLGRGIVNVFTGWMEIPKNIAAEWQKTDPFTGCVIGTIEGIGWSWGRTAVGFYDIVTFPLPVPKDYQPLMEPEFILPDIWGADFPHYAKPL